MKKGVLLYYVTAGWALLTAAIGLHFLLSSMDPTADVKSRNQAILHTFPIESWKPGDVKRLSIEGRPVIIGRRSSTEIATAMAQAQPSISVEDWEQYFNDGSLEDALGSQDFARLDWFIVSAISTASFGCIVLSQAGDYGGFLDPCQGVHFDMLGRPQKGPSLDRLPSHPIYFTESGQALVIDISRLPSPR